MILEKEDEMDCAVSGCNFLLKAVRHEAFRYEKGQAEFASGGEALTPPACTTIGGMTVITGVDLQSQQDKRESCCRKDGNNSSHRSALAALKPWPSAIAPSLPTIPPLVLLPLQKTFPKS